MEKNAKKRKQVEFLKYGIYGTVTTAVNLFMFIALKESGLHYILANSVSYFLAVCLNYVLNRKYVFQKNQKDAKGMAGELIKFFAVRLLALAADNAFLYLLTGLSRLPAYPVRIGLSFVSILATFVVNKNFVFKGSSKKNDFAG
ncbi:MAG: GtrA family protein [Eubacterium sp.]|nr:GtrA family protein [Eubacterium sp.]